MAQQHREDIWSDQLMAELENDEVNRQLCTVDIFSWSPETQEQILAEWNDWKEESEKSGLCCDECGKMFKRAGNLKRHMKTHSEKEYECSHCHKKFDRMDNLNRHMEMHERRGAEREYTCNVCSEVFHNIFPFQAHQRNVHQVGGGKRAKTSIRRTKRQRTDESEPTRPSTPVNEGKHLLCVFRLTLSNTTNTFSPFQKLPRLMSSTKVKFVKRCKTSTFMNGLDNNDLIPNGLSWILPTRPTFYVSKLRDHPVGRSVRLPRYVLENPAIVSLDCSKQTGLSYEDKLCFFRCLALHRGCHPKNLERDTHYFYEQYSQDDDFDGVALEELPELEK
ncbi:Zinc finger 653 [Paramuricea clavata]|uniref:Zinc finger 653 n=1 Tax=Paramuricea clavata TaxID=317549 RepID=A0A7D9JJP1_PARCT|nr:Zinc finger 653 [Paramuricea clavata]